MPPRENTIHYRVALIRKKKEGQHYNGDGDFLWPNFSVSVLFSLPQSSNYSVLKGIKRIKEGYLDIFAKLHEDPILSPLLVPPYYLELKRIYHSCLEAFQVGHHLVSLDVLRRVTCPPCEISHEAVFSWGSFCPSTLCILEIVYKCECWWKIKELSPVSTWV